MMDMSIDASAWSDMVHRIKEQIGPVGQDKIVAQAALKARTGLIEATPKITGSTRKAWQLPEGADGVRKVANTSKVMIFLEDGTRPHEIRATRKKALHWVSGGTATYGSKAKHGGDDVFAVVVHHPGTKAQQIVKNFIPTAQQILYDTCQAALRWASGNQ